MNKKNLSILIIIIFVAIISWIFLFSKENPTITQDATEFPTTSSARETIDRPTFTTFDFQKEENNESQSFLNKNLSFLSPETEIFQEVAPVIEQFTPIIYENPQNEQDIEIVLLEKPKLSEVEIEQIVFNKLYPDYFTDGLTFTQNVFVEQSFLSEGYEMIESFDSEEEIFAFVNTIINVFEEQGFYSEEEAVKFRIGANQTWKSILDDERSFFRKELISSELSKKIFANILFNAQRKTSKKIINIVDKLEGLFLKEAQAEECFRAKGGGSSGSNVSAPCCNCGLKCGSHGCVPVDDCGSGGSACDVQLGCKNLYGAGRAVIWDSSNGICGIG